MIPNRRRSGSGLADQEVGGKMSRLNLVSDESGTCHESRQEANGTARATQESRSPSKDGCFAHGAGGLAVVGGLSGFKPRRGRLQFFSHPGCGFFHTSGLGSYEPKPIPSPITFNHLILRDLDIDGRDLMTWQFGSACAMEGARRLNPETTQWGQGVACEVDPVSGCLNQNFGIPGGAGQRACWWRPQDWPRQRGDVRCEESMMSKLRILACLSLLLVLPAMAVAQKPSKSVVPVLNSISPSSATAGGSAFTLTATGSKFTNGSVLRWNGSAVPTTVISSTQLQATLGSSQLASAGTATVFVFTSGRFGGTSNGLTFTINAPAPPPPPPPPPPAGDLTITTPSVPAGTAGSDYQANLAASGGTPAYTWSKASGSLPSGVTLQADGKLTGKPSQAGGPFTFTAQAKDSATQAQIATRELSMTVAAPPPPPGGGSYLFQSSGASPLSGWDSVWTKTDVTAASLVPTDPSFDPTPGLQRQGSAGTSLIKIHYAICGDSTKPTVCGEAHQDSNLNVTKYFNSSNGNPNGLE
ncbi:MAG: IPT/TIG domain-containing protein, partial [Acidobacteriia bacterium]|nr:IPT/TIG domain-containing protein [Terriglobia bacterium]